MALAEKEVAAAKLALKAAETARDAADASTQAEREADVRSKEGALAAKENLLAAEKNALAAKDYLLAAQTVVEKAAAIPAVALPAQLALTKPELVQRLGAFIETYRWALPAPAPSMIGTDSMGGVGKDFPYRIMPDAVAAIRDIFVKNVRNAGSVDRNAHPVGVLTAAPGTGKTRGLLELATTLQTRCRLDAPSPPLRAMDKPEAMEEADKVALTALQAGHYRRVDLLIWTYNNGNQPMETDMKLGAPASTALRMLHAATCTPACKFRNFMDGLGTAGLLAEGTLDTLTPSDVLELIRARQGLADDEPWLLLLGIDEYNKLFEPADIRVPDSLPVVKNPAVFLSQMTVSLGPLVEGQRPAKPGSLSRTTVVAYLAGTMPGIMARGGEVFRPSGLTPKFIPLAPLSLEDCAAICDAQPKLASCWRTLRDFRRLMEALRGWPRPFEALVEETVNELQCGPDGIKWQEVYKAVQEIVKVKTLANLASDAALICPAMLCTRVKLSDVVPGAAVADVAMTWEKLVELGGAMLVQNGDAHQVIVTNLYIQMRVRHSSMDRLPPELYGLAHLFQAVPAVQSVPGAPPLSDLDFEELIAHFEAIRPELLLGALQWSTPRLKRRVELREYYAAGRFGEQEASGFDKDVRGRPEIASLEMLLPAEVQGKLVRAKHQFPKILQAQWDNGHVFHNAKGASFGDYWRVARCWDPQSASVVEVLIIGQMKHRETKGLITDEMVAVEHKKVAVALKDSGLEERFSGRWLLVLHTTARAAVALADLPMNVVLIDADGIETHMGPVLSSALRLMIRGRKANVNASSEAELNLVDGIGNVTAAAICAARGHGGYRDWEDLRARVPAVWSAGRLKEDNVEF